MAEANEEIVAWGWFNRLKTSLLNEYGGFVVELIDYA